MNPSEEDLNKNHNYWVDRYLTQNIGWHIEDFHPVLVKHIDKFIDNGKESKKVLVPLCGKSKDLIFLLSKGFSVFGVENVLQPILEFGKENSIELHFNEKESIYEAFDGKLKIFYGDFFTAPIKSWGPFDFVFDRGSFTALEYNLRSTYIQSIKNGIFGTNYKYFLHTVQFDKSKFNGPPKCTDEADLNEFWRSWNNVEILEKVPIVEGHPMMKVTDKFEDANEIYYFMTPN